MSGDSQSCGCLAAERAAETGRLRPGHRMRGTPTYNTWSAMKQRCLYESGKQFKNYGGRGIKVCARWMSFANFLADMGVRPEGTTLDRYPDLDGDYGLSNCRWATPAQQGANQRKTILWQGKSLVEWAAETGIKYTTLYARYRMHNDLFPNQKRRSRHTGSEPT